MSKLSSFITKHPILGIFVSLLIIIVLAIGIPNIQLDPDIANMLPDDIPSKITDDKIEKQFGANEIIVVAVTAADKYKNIYNPEVLIKAKEINDKLENAPYVYKVISIFDVKDVLIKEDKETGYESLYTKDMVDSDDDLKNPEKIRERVNANPTVKEQLVSKDEKSLLISAMLKSEISMKDWLSYVGIDTKDIVKIDSKMIHKVVDEDLIEGNPPLPKELKELDGFKENADKIAKRGKNPAGLVAIYDDYNKFDKDKKRIGDIKITIAGIPYLRYCNATRMALDMRTFLGIGFIVILIFLFLSFRTLRGVLLPFVVIVLSIVASLGLIGWMNEKLYIISILLFPILIALANDYGIHIISEYNVFAMKQSELKGKESKQKIVKNVLIIMVAVTFVAFITTITGFLSLTSHTLRPAQLLGLFAAFGLLIAFFLSIVFIPSVLVLLPVPKKVKEKKYGKYIDKALGRFGSFIYENKKKVLGIFLVVVVLIGVWIPKIGVDSDVFNFYPEDSDVIEFFDFITANFGGSVDLSLLLESDKENAFKSYEVLSAMNKLQNYIKNLKMPESDEKAVGMARSVIDFIAHINAVQFYKYNNNNLMEKIPDPKMMTDLKIIDKKDIESGNYDVSARIDRLLAQYFFTYESAQDPGIEDQFVDIYTYQTARMMLRLSNASYERLELLVNSINKYLEKNKIPNVKVNLGGFAMNMYYLPKFIIKSQIYSLFYTFLLVILIVMISFRSISSGLISAVPLLSGVAIVFGMMSLLNINLDIITAMLTSILIAVGIDYTIHFLWRFKLEIAKGNDSKTALINTMTTIGKGILFNATSVIMGFIVMLFGNFMPVVYFGVLITTSIFVCLVGAFTIIPIITILVKPKFIYKQGSTNNQE